MDNSKEHWLVVGKGGDGQGVFFAFGRDQKTDVHLSYHSALLKIKVIVDPAGQYYVAACSKKLKG